MASINIIKTGAIYLTDYQENILPLFDLDYSDCMQNKSRIPLHTMIESETVGSMLKNTFDQSKELLLYTNNQEFLSHVIVDSLLSRRLATTCAPVKTLEMGCTNGKLSYHLAQILGKFHPDSLLTLMDREISNEKRSVWLDTIAAADCTPEINVVISNYEQTGLADHSFDIIVINQVNRFLHPVSLMREVRRLVKENGLILCLYNNDPLVESSFKLAFPQYTAYALTPFQGVLKAELCVGCSFFDLETQPENPVKQLIGCVEAYRNERFDPASYDKIMRQIDAALSESILQYRLEEKLALLQLEEAILSTIDSWKQTPDQVNYEALDNVLSILRNRI